MIPAPKDVAGSLELSGDVFQVARELGLFRAGDVAALTGHEKEQVEAMLRANPAIVERVPGKGDKDERWRVRAVEADTNAAPPAIDYSAAQQLAKDADAALQSVEKGTVLEPERRKITLEVAEQRMQLARSAVGDTDDPELANRLAKTQRRLTKLRERAEARPEPLLARLADWTATLPQPDKQSEAGDFKPQDAVRAAARQAADPNAVFVPALAALASGFAHSSEHAAGTVDELDKAIRKAALEGRVFEVLALGCLAAVSGLGVVADGLVAAITTPAFSSVVDRTGRRIAYTALANLARPATVEGYRAVAACAYLMRRERPGRDEMELLAPAAIQSETIDGAAEFLLYAQWLKWEREHDPLAQRESSLPQFGHVARNLGYALDSSGYEQFKRALPSLANHELSELLVHHLADKRNDALDLRSLRPPRRPDDDYDADDDRDIAPDRPQFGAKPQGASGPLHQSRWQARVHLSAAATWQHDGECHRKVEVAAVLRWAPVVQLATIGEPP